jgi:hypothetical protein
MRALVGITPSLFFCELIGAYPVPKRGSLVCASENMNALKTACIFSDAHKIITNRSPRPAVNKTPAVNYSKLFLCTQACHTAFYHGPVFVVKWVLRRSAASVGEISTFFLRLRPHLDLFPLGVHYANIRIAHLLCSILFLMT